nr:hypothetical protein [Butyrivibrio sp.]
SPFMVVDSNNVNYQLCDSDNGTYAEKINYLEEESLEEEIVESLDTEKEEINEESDKEKEPEKKLKDLNIDEMSDIKHNSKEKRAVV